MKRLFILPLISLSLLTRGQDLEGFLTAAVPDKVKADSVFSLARKNFRKARFDSVEYWLNKGQVFADRSRNDELIARYYVERGNMKYMQGRFREGIGNIQKAGPHLANTESYDLHNSALLIAGNCYSSLQRKDSAFYYYKLCEKYNNEKFPYRNWLVYSLIGELFNHTQDYTEAEQYFQKAYRLTAAQEGKPDHGYLLTQFANFYLGNNKALEFGMMVNEYNELINERKKKNGMEPAHNLMYLSWISDSLENKIRFMQEVKSASLQGGHYLQAILANGYIISFYEKNKQFDKALLYAEENLQLSAKHGALLNEYQSAKIKYELLKKMNREAEAARTADRLFILKDSILAMQHRELLYDLETKYQTEQKEKEIALLKSQHALNRLELKTEMEKREALQRENLLKGEKLAKEQLLRLALLREKVLIDSSLTQQQKLNATLDEKNSLKESELQKEKLLTAALSRENNLKQESINKDRKNNQRLWTGIALLVLAGGIILWQFSRQLTKNKIIRKQADEMEVLNREIHHRVKNNLQVISSLLDIQSQTLQDEEAAEVIRESRQRVQSMAFIHQNLYQSDSVQEVEINNYINNLAGHLFQTYNIRNDRIRFHTDIDKLSLHTDTVIPIGMILNELISNSLKYAFRNLEEGEIRVAMKQKENELYLQVKDNGHGLPPGFDMAKLQSFGFKVIRAFAQKLKARLHVDGSHGTNVELVISKFKTI